MTRLAGYVARRLVSGIVAVWCALVVVDAAFALLGSLADADRQGFLRQFLFETPARAYALFPMACLIGGLWRMGEFAAERELVAARVAGLAPARLALWVLGAGIALSLPALWLGEGVAPEAAYRAQLLRAGGTLPNLGVEPDRELWVRDGPRMVRIGSVEGPGLLLDLQLVEFGADRALRTIATARAARYEQGRWYLEAFAATAFAGDTVTVELEPRKRWEAPLDPGLIDVLARTPEQMSLPELRRYIDYLAVNRLATARYALAFWARVAAPVTAWVMLLLGLAIVLSRTRHWRTGSRLLAGVLVGLGFKLLADTTAQAALVYGLAPALAVWTPVSGAALLAAALYARAR